MRRTITLRFTAGLLGLGLLAAACGDDTDAADEVTTTTAPATTETTAEMEEAEDTTTTTAAEAEEMDIVDTAVAAGDFTTLAAALEAADLVDALKGDGPFTVFAPTDDAFAALPPGTVDGLLADVPALQDVLQYHAVEGEVMAEDVVELTEAAALNGQVITIAVENGEVVLNGQVRVTMTDIEASNGVIHVIDGVLLPPAS